jgi:uncharacterized repeat protein (TIGR03843 family)
VTDPARHRWASPERREALRDGDVEIVGRMPYSSNTTLLVEVTHGDSCDRAIYKPGQGERPLWDFPPALYKREVAAYELALALGWDLVPTTVIREGPLGEGSLQQFVDADFEEHYFTICEGRGYDDQLGRVCLFDLLANNTDCKSGHCLLDTEGHVWAIDNALCFSAEFKLRTVIWDFAGDPIPDALLADVDRVVTEGLPHALDELLDPFEREGIRARAEAALRQRVFPHDPTGRRYPWPMV